MNRLSITFYIMDTRWSKLLPFSFGDVISEPRSKSEACFFQIFWSCWFNSKFKCNLSFKFSSKNYNCDMTAESWSYNSSIESLSSIYSLLAFRGLLNICVDWRVYASLFILVRIVLISASRSLSMNFFYSFLTGSCQGFIKAWARF